MLVTIKKIGINGEGIGYYKKKPVFIDNVLIDEIVDVEITQEEEKYIFAKVKKIIKKSKDRVEPKCKLFSYCGGCQLQHVDYQKGLELKKEILVESAEKYAKLDASLISNITGAKHSFNYRNELKLPLKEYEGKIYAGMYLKGSNSFKRINYCMIHDKGLEDVKNRVIDELNFNKIHAYSSRYKDGVRYIILRRIGNDYQLDLMFGLKRRNESLISSLKKIKSLKTIYFSYNTNKDPLINPGKQEKIFGEDYLNLKVDEYDFKVHMNAFLQLNLSQAENIYKYIANNIVDGKIMVEEYAGIGIMSIMNAYKFDKVYASEINPYSIQCFKENILLNDYDNIEVEVADAYKHLEKINEKIDCLVVDPPRSGMDHKMIKTILDKDIKQIVYMSCNPSTLFKNIDALKKNFKVKSIKAFDMHAYTSHIETVAILEKR